MTTLICNKDASGNYDLLTDEHAACSYGQPVIVHLGVALGKNDVYDNGLFGTIKPAKNVTIDTGSHGPLDDDQFSLLQKWQAA